MIALRQHIVCTADTKILLEHAGIIFGVVWNVWKSVFQKIGSIGGYLVRRELPLYSEMTLLPLPGTLKKRLSERY